MAQHEQRSLSAAFWMVICCLLPILVIYGLAAVGIVISPLILVLMMLFCWLAMSSHLMAGCHAEQDRRSASACHAGDEADEGPGRLHRRLAAGVRPSASNRANDNH